MRAYFGRALSCAAVMTIGLTTTVHAQNAVPAGTYDLRMWQMDPFNVGYSLTGGYRSLYSGVPQPVGHEIVETHGGSGYVYRPVYGPEPFYGWQHFGSYGVVFHGTNSRALVIDNPGTPYEKRYTPSSSSLQAGHAGMIDVMPHVSLDAIAPSYAGGHLGGVVPATHVAPRIERSNRPAELPVPNAAPVGVPREF